MAVKFQIGDEVVVNNFYPNDYYVGYEGIIKSINSHGLYQISINNQTFLCLETEIDLKYSFSKDEVVNTLNEIYNSHGEQYEYTILTKKIVFPMSALQVKNKFGSVLLDQLLLNRSPEA